MGINNVSSQPQSLGSNNLSLQNDSKRYFVNPNAVDKTPQSDTVQLSNRNNEIKKIGIGAAIVGTGVGLFYLLRGKKPPTKVMEQATETVVDTKPKMVITEEAKKIYDDVSKKIHKKTQVTLETIDDNLKPKEKAGSWSSDDMKEFYTKLEKESDAKIAAEKAAKEAAEKAAKEAEAKAAKEAASKSAYEKVLKNIEKSKFIKAKADEIMSRPDFEDNLKEFMDTKIKVYRRKSVSFDHSKNCPLEETIEELLNKTIEGEYTEPIENLYHGTNSHSLKDILSNGFSLDACNRGESGKGIYFGLDKKKIENVYASLDGSIITAKYSGGKIASVNGGLFADIEESSNTKQLFEDIFQLDIFDKDFDDIYNEILNRVYTQKLRKMGYDAVYGYSHNACTDYLAVFDPKNIQILK